MVWLVKIAIRDGVHGKGVFAAEDIKKGTRGRQCNNHRDRTHAHMNGLYSDGLCLQFMQIEVKVSLSSRMIPPPQFGSSTKEISLRGTVLFKYVFAMEYMQSQCQFCASRSLLSYMLDVAFTTQRNN